MGFETIVRSIGNDWDDDTQQNRDHHVDISKEWQRLARRGPPRRQRIKYNKAAASPDIKRFNAPVADLILQGPRASSRSQQSRELRVRPWFSRMKRARFVSRTIPYEASYASRCSLLRKSNTGTRVAIHFSSREVPFFRHDGRASSSRLYGKLPYYGDRSVTPFLSDPDSSRRAREDYAPRELRTRSLTSSYDLS